VANSGLVALVLDTRVDFHNLRRAGKAGSDQIPDKFAGSIMVAGVRL
jgi:hypothetical protein